MKSNPKSPTLPINPAVPNNPIAAPITQQNKMLVPDSIIKQKNALVKGRATAAANKGTITESEKDKIHEKANRGMGYNFHTHPGS